jgi:replicative DNA helicase
MSSRPAQKINGKSDPRTSPAARAGSAANPLGAVLERVLPHSPDAERALLGAMLLDESAIGEAIAVLSDVGGPVFWSERHQKLYDHIVELWKLRRPIDGIVIRDELERKQIFEELGGYDFLAELVSAVPSAQRVTHYAQIVRHKYLLRQLINACYRVMNSAFDGSAPAQEILDQAEAEIFRVTERRVAHSAETLMAQIDELFRRIQDRQKHEGEPTGYYGLDEMTSGLHKGELIIIAGRPSMGKTALGLNIAEHMAIDLGIPVLFFSLEMSRAALAERILCGRARVDAHRLRRALTTPPEVERLKAAAGDLAGKPLYVDDTPGLSILELRARARIAWRKYGIRAVFVDYLQLMHAPERRNESRQTEVAEISRGLKALSKDLDVPVIAMAQLNRNPEDRRSNRPRMSDLRESGAIEQDADLIILLHRESYYRDKARSEEDLAASGPPPVDPEDFKAELIIDKQRNGPTGVVELYFDRRFTRFENYDPTRVRRYAGVPEAEYGSSVEAPF